MSTVNTCKLIPELTVSTTNTTVVAQSSSKQIYNSTTLKLLNRLLEEASQTGDILLSNKNLTEFPSKLALNYDLSDTITADLSRNNLTELPKEVCLYDSLEKLSLYSNLIRIVPNELTGLNQLRCLKVLDLNSNNLSYLPASLCNLVSLQVLTVNNNRLVSLPEEIGRLTKLIQLDVSCNEITHLPVQIGEMTSLRALNLRRNLLVELPKEIAQLKLVNFDCSSNRLSKLPLCFREMNTLIDLVVDHNPLEVPPAHICTKGLLHIMKYLLVESVKEEKKRGILSEYEINSQYNSSSQRFNSISNNNNSNNGWSFSSYMFQSSVRNMCKNLNSGHSSSMSTVSTGSSASSTASTSSSSSLKHMSKQISPPFPPVASANSNQIKSNHGSISPSSSSSSSTSSVSTPTNKDLDSVDYTNVIEQSSNHSSSSSSPQINLIKNNDQTTSSSHSKSMSIHELISLKSPTTTNKINNSSSLSSHNSLNNINAKNYLKNNNSYNNSDIIDFTISQQQQQIWRLNEETNNYNINNCKNQQNNKLQNFDNNFSMLSGLSLNNNNNNNSNTNTTSNNNNTNHANSSFSSTKLQTINNLNANKQRLALSNEKNNGKLAYGVYNHNTSILQRNQNNNMNTLDMTNSTTTNIQTTQPTPNLTSSNSNNNNNNTIKIKSQNDITYNTSTNSSTSPTSITSSTSSDDYNKSKYLTDTVDLINEPTIEINDATYTKTKLVAKNIKNEEFQNTTITTQLEQACYMINNGLTTTCDFGDKYYAKFQPGIQQHQQQQQQQVWIPRDQDQENQIEKTIEENNINPAFTIKRHFIQIQEEQKLIETLKKSIETKLKIQLPTASSVEEMGISLADGVVLCHLINQIIPRAVQIIHVPSLALPKLSLAKCRKNVENFIEACRRIGIPENDLCCPQDIIEAKNTVKVARTVMMLISYGQYIHQQHQQQNNIDGVDYNRQPILNSNNITTIGNAMSMSHHNYNYNHHYQSQPKPTQTQQQQTAV